MSLLVWGLIAWAAFIAAVLVWGRHEGRKSCRAGYHDVDPGTGRCLRCKAQIGPEVVAW